jgi:hypothetical protein
VAQLMFLLLLVAVAVMVVTKVQAVEAVVPEE